MSGTEPRFVANPATKFVAPTLCPASNLGTRSHEVSLLPVQEFRISLANTEQAKAQAAALYEYNVETTEMDDRAPIGAELCDASGKILGGLWDGRNSGFCFSICFSCPSICVDGRSACAFWPRSRRERDDASARELSWKRAASRRASPTAKVMGNKLGSISELSNTPGSFIERLGRKRQLAVAVR